MLYLLVMGKPRKTHTPSTCTPAWTYSKVRGSGSIHIRPKTLVEIQLPSPYSLKHGITVAWTHTLPLPTHVPAVPLPCSRVNNTYHSPFDLCFVEVSCALLGKRLDKEGAHAQKSSPTALRRHPRNPSAIRYANKHVVFMPCLLLARKTDKLDAIQSSVLRGDAMADQTRNIRSPLKKRDETRSN